MRCKRVPKTAKNYQRLTNRLKSLLFSAPLNWLLRDVSRQLFGHRTFGNSISYCIYVTSNKKMRCSFLECWSTPDKNVTFMKSVHSWLQHQLAIIFIWNLGWNYNPAELTQNFIKETQGIKIRELNLAHSGIVFVSTWACALMFWNFQGFQTTFRYTSLPHPQQADTVFAEKIWRLQPRKQ